MGGFLLGGRGSVGPWSALQNDGLAAVVHGFGVMLVGFF